MASLAGDTLDLDVQARFRASPMIASHILYLAEERSEWRNGVLERVAVNNRYLFDGAVVRQQWDVFTRRNGALVGQRLQGKRARAFDRAHPGFAAHWSPDAFGLPAPLPPGLTPPLALLFYQVRFLPRRASMRPVFLPGFKGERVVSTPLAPTAWGAGIEWSAALRYHALRDSTADAWVAPDGTLRAVAMTLHGDGRTAEGRVDLQGCAGG